MLSQNLLPWDPHPSFSPQFYPPTAPHKSSEAEGVAPQRFSASHDVWLPVSSPIALISSNGLAISTHPHTSGTKEWTS